MNQIPLTHYVAFNAPENAKKILRAWGVPVTGGNKKALADSLSALLRQEGNGVFMDLINLHPDKEYILQLEQIKKENGAQAAAEPNSGCDGGKCQCSEKKSGACGCSGFAGGSWNGGEGAYYSPNRNPNVDEFQVYGFEGTPMSNKGALLFGGIALFLAYSLYKGG